MHFSMHSSMHMLLSHTGSETEQNLTINLELHEAYLGNSRAREWFTTVGHISIGLFCWIEVIEEIGTHEAAVWILGSPRKKRIVSFPIISRGIPFGPPLRNQSRPSVIEPFYRSARKHTSACVEGDDILASCKRTAILSSGSSVENNPIFGHGSNQFYDGVL